MEMVIFTDDMLELLPQESYTEKRWELFLILCIL
jgi:hypothetical protein